MKGVDVIILCAVSLTAGSCTESENRIVNPPSDIDLLANGSFESGGVGSLQGWEANTTDTSFINFSNDVPAGGGVFSVALRNEWSFPGSLRQTIIPPPGLHRYRLRASAKAVRSGPMTGGTMRIEFKEAGVWNTTKTFDFTDTTWTSASLLDTITTVAGVAGDTIAISLSGNSDQFSAGVVLFDLVEFVRLD